VKTVNGWDFSNLMRSLMLGRFKLPELIEVNSALIGVIVSDDI
jgi:hypothetical protein